MLKHSYLPKGSGQLLRQDGARTEAWRQTIAIGARQSPGWRFDSHGAVKQAAGWPKTDLTTELVKEFTELQGIVGGLYAKAQGLPRGVADAIYDQYKPEST